MTAQNAATATSPPALALQGRRRLGSRLMRLVLPVIGALLRLASLAYRTMRWTLESIPPAITDRVSRERALETARRAARRVPAYRRWSSSTTRCSTTSRPTPLVSCSSR